MPFFKRIFTRNLQAGVMISAVSALGALSFAPPAGAGAAPASVREPASRGPAVLLPPSPGEEKSAKDKTNPLGLSDEEKAQVDALKKRDREVRAHERAHAAAGGQYTGAPTFSYESGPDGRQYAVGGEVAIDASPIAGDPQATITKMQIVRSAALAPAKPSGQDRAVAAQADAQRARAQAELAAGGGRDERSGPASTGNAENATSAYRRSDRLGGDRIIPVITSLFA
jgi:hypothetical protein